MPRETTNKLLEMVDEGILDARTLALACLKYMSEDDVENMAKANEFLEDEVEEGEPADDEFGEEQSCPYLLFGGRAKDNLQPISAWPIAAIAISAAIDSLHKHKYLEVVYMPEDDVDTNEVVWRSWEVK